MKKEYAKYLVNKTIGDYNLMAADFSSKREYLPADILIYKDIAKDGDCILDFGCGNGRLTQMFSELKNIKYWGMDASKKLINIAKEKYPDNKFIYNRTVKLPFAGEYFDKIFAMAVFHHIPSHDLRLSYLKELKRVIKPDGIMVLTVWEPNPTIVKNQLSKNNFRKFFGFSELDYGDAFISFNNSRGEEIVNRYVHCFTKWELTDLVREAGFSIAKSGVAKHGGRGNKNLYVIARND
jgi:ubiquinone/menaquinone biosynthesis C-methylase UbiE